MSCAVRGNVLWLQSTQRNDDCVRLGMKGDPEVTVFNGIDPTEYKPVAVNQHHRDSGKRVIFRGEIHPPLQDGLMSPGRCGPTHDKRDKNTCFEKFHA